MAAVKKTPTKKSTKKKTTTKKKSIEKTPTSAQIEKQVRQVLVELLDESESDSVRVAAAKALMDRIDKGKNAKDASSKKISKSEKEEREAAIAEATKLLAELTSGKSGSVARKSAVAKGCKARTAHTTK